MGVGVPCGPALTQSETLPTMGSGEKWMLKDANAKGFFACFLVGANLRGPGGTAAQQQLHRGAAGRHVLGAGAPEERQGLPTLQHLLLRQRVG